MQKKGLSETWIKTCKDATRQGRYATALWTLETEMALIGITDNKAGRIAHRFAALGGVIQDKIRQKRDIQSPPNGRVPVQPRYPTPEDLAEVAGLYANAARRFIQDFPVPGARRVQNRLEKLEIVALTPVKNSFVVHEMA